MHTLDLSLFYSIYGLSGYNTWVDWLIIFLGEYLLYGLLALVAYFLIHSFYKKQTRKGYGYIAAVLGALIARFGVASAIRLMYHRPRPFLALHLPHLLTDTSYSFPSGHTIFLFALATGVWFVNKRLGYFLYKTGLLVGLARVAGGVHYPSDILGGIILGIATAWVVHAMWQLLPDALV